MVNLERAMRHLARQGAEVSRTRNGWRIRPPDGSAQIIVHTTESDPRALKNTRARIRRAGLSWKD